MKIALDSNTNNLSMLLIFISHFSGRFFTLFWATRVGEAVCFSMAMSLLNGKIINQFMLLCLWFYCEQIVDWFVGRLGLNESDDHWSILNWVQILATISQMTSLDLLHLFQLKIFLSLPTDHPKTSISPQSTSPPIVVIFLLFFPFHIKCAFTLL